MPLTACTADGAEAPLGLVAPPQLAWRFAPADRPLIQQAWRVTAASSAEVLAAGRCDRWDSGWIADGRQTGIAWGGTALPAQSETVWQVRVRDQDGDEHAGPVQRFEMGPSTEDWAAADWLGAGWLAAGRAILFRSTFQCAALPRRVRLHVAAAGVHLLRCNGQAITEAVLLGGPFDRDQVVPYTSHDLTPLARVGENAVGVVVGHGWHGQPLLKALIEIEHADGSRWTTRSLRINGHDLWLCRPGGWITDQLYDGVDVDARRQPPGWDDVAMPDDHPPRQERWFPPRRMTGPSGRMWPRPVQAYRLPAIIPRDDGTVDGVRRLDVGENIAGWARISVEAPAGTRIAVRYGELRDAAGRLNQEPLYLARAADSYICRGGGREVFEPLLAYHGFRYLEVDGLPAGGTVEAVPVMSDCPVRASLTCSEPLIERLWQVYQRSEQGNLLHVPTDCPNRTERMGWLNDLTGRGESLIWARDAARLLSGWMEQIAAAQDGEGRIPDTVPYHWGHRAADPVCIGPATIPWRLWRHFGDRRTLERMRPVAERWLGWWLGQRQGDGLVHTHFWGDWCPPKAYGWNDGPAPRLPEKSLVATACIARMARVIAASCAALGDDVAAARHRATAETLAAAIHARHFDATRGCYGIGDQASQALMLAWDLAPAGERARIQAVLIADVAERGHLTTGNIATLPLLHALSDAGRGDLAWGLVVKRDYPSWGYMVDHGATTLWERWEGGASMDMNSHNHPMLGVYPNWLVERVVGLRDDESLPPGHCFVLRPDLPAGLERIGLDLDTVHGRLGIAIADHGRRILVDVPPNTRIRCHDGRVLGPGRHQPR
jgi:alpha-L-rhamnosidase